MATEEDRAELYRQQQIAREAAERERLAQLAGNPAARAALNEAWRPVRDRTRDEPRA
jgi:hypothetical protein